MRLSKIKKTTRLSIVVLALCMTMNSCLKDNTPPPLYTWPVPSLVSFQDNGGEGVGGAGYGSTTAPYPLYDFPLTFNNNDTAGFAAIVVYGPNGNAPTDITVNLAIDTAALSAFNAYNFTNFIAPDPSTYTFPSSVVIAKGTTQAYARVTVSNNATPISGANYAIPLMITGVSSGQYSSNFGIEINAFSVN